MHLATDPLSLLFIGCFLFGFLFLLVTALLGSFHGAGMGHGAGGHAVGHHVTVGTHSTLAHHAGHAHGHTVSHTTGRAAPQGSQFSLFTYLNPTSIVLFLLGFGFFGYFFHNATGLALPLVMISAVIAGFIIASLLLLLLNRIFGHSDATTIQDVADRTGLLGKVGTTIQENGLGEMIYVSPGGMRKSIPARSVDGRRMERDQEVVVVNYQQGVAEVDTWEHFMNQEEERTSSPAPANEDDLSTLRSLLEEHQKNDSTYVMRNESQKE